MPVGIGKRGRGRRQARRNVRRHVRPGVRDINDERRVATREIPEFHVSFCRTTRPARMTP